MIVRGTVVDVEALVVKFQADRALEYDLEGAVAEYNRLTAAIAHSREPGPWCDSHPFRLRKATGGDPVCGRSSSFFGSHSGPA